MKAPRVSVILNIRNGAPYLREAIDSALAQTYEDWEMIAWDDCSKDESADIVAGYTDPRIRYSLSPTDEPLGAARNRAIALARGDWLAFLDQDDVWHPDKLCRQLALVQKSGSESVAILYGRTVVFSDCTGAERDFDYRHEYSPLPQGRIFETLFRDSCFIAMSSAVLRRDAVLGLGGIPPEYSVIADYFLYVEVARRYEARAVESPICRYRLHAANMSLYARRVENEQALILIERLAPELAPSLVAWRRRVHWTVVAFDELIGGEPLRGVRDLLAHGSVPYLLSRPAVRVWRAARRVLQTPEWKKAS